jgi:hypothetical protein
MANDFEEDVLQHIFRAIRAYEAADVVVEDSLNAPQQLFQRLAVPNLAAENQMGFVDAVVQDCSPLTERRRMYRVFECP